MSQQSTLPEASDPADVSNGGTLVALEDENAFGVWIAYFSLEDDEYSLGAEEFAQRFATYRRLLHEHVAQNPLAGRVRALQFGHALYLEFAEDEILETQDGAVAPVEQRRALISWVKTLRLQLNDAGYETLGVVSYGGRWLEANGNEVIQAGSLAIQQVSLPSEPLRRAMYADTASHGVPTDAEAWGPGLYVDTEAVGALGLTPKNAPTPLSAADATFYRMGR